MQRLKPVLKKIDVEKSVDQTILYSKDEEINILKVFEKYYAYEPEDTKLSPKAKIICQRFFQETSPVNLEGINRFSVNASSGFRKIFGNPGNMTDVELPFISG